MLFHENIYLVLAVWGLLVAARGCSLVAVLGLLTAVVCLVGSEGSKRTGFCGCSLGALGQSLVVVGTWT